jgi:hypothetical protein
VDPARQAGILVLGTTLATLSSALAPLLVVRLIGKADVGRLLSVTLVYETVAMLLSTGFPYTLLYQLGNREAPERAAIARRIAGIAGKMGAAGAAAVVAVALIFRSHPFGYVPSPTFESQLGMLLVLAPSLIADLPFRLMPNLLVAEGAARRSAGLQVARTLALTLATLVPLALKAEISTVIVVYAVVRWVFGLFVFYELRRLYHALPRVPVPLTTAAFWKFALPLGATEALGYMNQQVDRWLVLLALPAERFAEYQIGAWQVPIIGTIAYSVGAAYTPELARLFQAKDPYGAIRLWQQGIHKTALIVIPVTIQNGTAVRDEYLCSRAREPQGEIGGHRVGTDLAPDAICTEKSSAHCPLPASSKQRATRTASTVSFTSCARIMCAPCNTATTAAAMLADRRLSTSRPEIAPNVDLREIPISTGHPIRCNCRRFANNSTFCAAVLPKPKPGSTSNLSRRKPAATHSATRASRNCVTSATTST